MLTPGRSYHFTLWANAAEGTTTGLVKVLEVQMPLVRVRDEGGAETIINVHSPAFVAAKEAEGRGV